MDGTGKFLDSLVVSPVNDGINWYLCSDFRYMRDRNDLTSIITVPIGFVTDFASIPRALWNVLPKWDIYGPAAVVHDWLYWNQGTTRDTADRILFEAMKILNVLEWKQKAIYEAVEHFGEHAWKENAANKAAGKIRMTYVPVIVTKKEA